jgi:hypothetical protein
MSNEDNAHIADCSDSSSPHSNTYGNALCCQVSELCYDGVDNDGDGFVDCADPECNGESSPQNLDPYQESEPKKCRAPTCPTTWHVDLQGFWQFENTTEDAIGSVTSGNVNTGTLQGDATYTNHIDGKLGRALTLDGSGDYMSVPDDTSFYETLDPEDAVTVSAFVRSDDPTGVWEGVAVKQPSSYAVQLGYQRVRFEVTTTDGSTNIQSAAGSIDAGTWHHIVGTYNETSGEMKLYIDGSEVVNTTHSGTLQNTGGELHVGHDNGEYFDGEIDQVRLYHRELNTSEIAGFTDPACGNRQRTMECLRNPELCDTGYAGTSNYHCNYGTYDDPNAEGTYNDPADRGTGVCCPRNQEAERDPIFGEWRCSASDQCGLGGFSECNYNISDSSQEGQYLNDTYAGSGDTTWCQQQIPKYDNVAEQPAPAKSSACCYVPKQGELNWWFKDGNVKVYG